MKICIIGGGHTITGRQIVEALDHMMVADEVLIVSSELDLDYAKVEKRMLQMMESMCSNALVTPPDCKSFFHEKKIRRKRGGGDYDAIGRRR